MERPHTDPFSLLSVECRGLESEALPSRPSDYLRGNIPRFDIWLGSQSHGQCAAVNRQCCEGDSFEDRFVPKSPCPQCFKIFRAHRRTVSAQLKTKFEQGQIRRQKTSVLVVV